MLFVAMSSRLKEDYVSLLKIVKLAAQGLNFLAGTGHAEKGGADGREQSSRSRDRSQTPPLSLSLRNLNAISVKVQMHSPLNSRFTI